MLNLVRTIRRIGSPSLREPMPTWQAVSAHGASRALPVDRRRRNRFRDSLASTLVAYTLATAWSQVAPAQSERHWWHELPAFETERWEHERTGRARKPRRERIRSALTERLGPGYRMDVPYVSPSTLDAMRMAISRYRAIARNGDWPTVPDRTTLRMDDYGKHVGRLRTRLTITGDLRATHGRSWAFDAEVREAVARFQLRHGLPVTGFVDRRTRRALNVSATVRLRQLEINLERLQKLGKLNAATRYVFVNIPAFTLHAVKEGTIGLRSRVVVGKPSRQTPALSARILGLNFFPYWRVPDSIARKDLIPQLIKDPQYLNREHFKVLRGWGTTPIDTASIDWSSPEVRGYKFRQNPGPFNALGILRVNMPNKDIVYLHDTPLKRLFQRDFRAFSSGCVRVQRVLELAGWLLGRDADRPSASVNSVVADGKRKDIRLKKAVPVRFAYITAWATRNDVAHFRPDIYERDGVVAADPEQPDRPLPDSRAITP